MYSIVVRCDERDLLDCGKDLENAKIPFTKIRAGDMFVITLDVRHLSWNKFTDAINDLYVTEEPTPEPPKALEPDGTPWDPWKNPNRYQAPPGLEEEYDPFADE